MTTSLKYNKRAMKLTTQVKVAGESTTLLPMIRLFNKSCNALSVIAFQEKLFHWLPLQRRAYHWLRSEFGLTAAATLVAIRKVAYTYRNKARRNTLATFHPLGAIPLYKHSYRHDGQVRIYGKLFPFSARVPLGKNPAQAHLCYRDGRFYIHQAIDVPEPTPYQPQGFLGCDLGIVNILADSTGVVYSGAMVNGLRKRHARLRARLQSKGTRSARRLFKKRRRKESRFARDVNHVISKKVVTQAQRHSLGLALEDLRGIRGSITVKRGYRRALSSWAFQQLRFFIEYKARLAGVPVVCVNPRNTSRTCPQCGCVDKRNRPSQARFLCISCGFAGLADIIAAVNIGRRASGDVPNAPPEREMSESASSR